MISDALFDAVVSMREYLSEPTFDFAYSDPELREEIETVIGIMDTLRRKLDDPVDSPEILRLTAEGKQAFEEAFNRIRADAECDN